MTPRRDLPPMATIEQVAEQVRGIDFRLESQDKVDEERRKLDDDRYTHLAAGQKEVLSRVDTHGTRTTALETKWAAFFGDEGAFKLVMKNIDSQGKKIDKLMWLVACGIGGLAALEFIQKFFLGR